jgi:vancomycin resistance protein VanW
MRITERWCHSVDSYGEARYFELGRDAAIEFGYRDLRFVNPFTEPVVVCIEVTHDRVIAEIRAARPAAGRIDFIIEGVEPPPGSARGSFAVSTIRTLTTLDGRLTSDDLGISLYRRPVR